jgi:hypothetical protein
VTGRWVRGDQKRPVTYPWPRPAVVAGPDSTQRSNRALAGKSDHGVQRVCRDRERSDPGQGT